MGHRGFIVASVLLAGAYCSAQDLTAAVQKQLDHRKPACVALFDHNDATGHVQLKKYAGLGLPPRIQAYYDNGILVRTEQHVQVMDGMAGFVMSHGKNAWRYDWSPAVESDVLGDELCYGYHPVVSEVVWSHRLPNGKLGVEYTWRYERVADWAKEPWVRQKDPEVWRAQSLQESGSVELPIQ